MRLADLGGSPPPVAPTLRPRPAGAADAEAPVDGRPERNGTEASPHRIDRDGLLGSFRIPPGGEAGTPPELRRPAGRVGADGRADVRLMVARGAGDIAHRRFVDIVDEVAAGDVIVVNASAVIPAALDASGPDGSAFRLHLSTEQPGGFWVVEPRLPAGPGSLRFDGRPPAALRLPGGGRAELLAPYPPDTGGDPTGANAGRAATPAAAHGADAGAGGPASPAIPATTAGEAAAGNATGRFRLWLAHLELPEPVLDYLAEHGQPIRYAHVEGRWPIDAYQTVFSRVPGSVEMPSASRPFTDRLVTDLVAKGVTIVPIVLHTGVSSQEAGEAPYAERFEVPVATADVVNAARAAGGHVIAAGTTVVRALETTADRAGRAHPGHGWTELVVTPERGVRLVDGLITGWHEPESSHLAMLEAIAGRDLLEASYREAVAEGYRWHEFGDSHLILP
jgi:S-adenosylmethionine:tRNA ribosyltransferase-isomerase